MWQALNVHGGASWVLCLSLSFFVECSGVSTEQLLTLSLFVTLTLAPLMLVTGGLFSEDLVMGVEHLLFEKPCTVREIT